MDNKILSQIELEDISSKKREMGKKLVFTNGCFDIIHVGHIRYLSKAAEFGDLLIVALNSDSSVRELKGEKRPVINERERAEIVASLEMVDYVTVFSDLRCDNLLKNIKPDIYVKGGDYTPDTLPEWPTVKQYGGELRLINLVKGKSTTDIISRIKGL